MIAKGERRVISNNICNFRLVYSRTVTAILQNAAHISLLGLSIQHAASLSVLFVLASACVRACVGACQIVFSPVSLSPSLLCFAFAVTSKVTNSLLAQPCQRWTCFFSSRRTPLQTDRERASERFEERRRRRFCRLAVTSLAPANAYRKLHLGLYVLT